MDHPTAIAVSENRRAELVEILNACLANAIDMTYHAKQAHWNLRGPEFIGLHELFDKVSKHLRKQADRIAERAAALGGYVEGTVRASAQSSGLSEYDRDAATALEHCRAVASRLAAHALALRGAISRCDDPVTENLLCDIAETVEQDLWMLESHFLPRD
jgi:starvation-inducible DNA-binding protein